MAKKHVKTHPEADLQKDCVEWLRETFPEWLVFSCPNEACRNRVNWFKNLGMLPGAPDLIIVQLESVIFVEFKSETGRLSTNQIRFKQQAESLGHQYLVIRYLSDLKRFFGYFQ